MCNTIVCLSVRGDNPRALASGLSYVMVDKHGITILYHLHQCRPCTSRDHRAKVGMGVNMFHWRKVAKIWFSRKVSVSLRQSWWQFLATTY